MKTTILVVEDNMRFFDIIKMILIADKTDQYNILHANNGIEGIEYVLVQTPDIILLDIEMPRLNGYEMLGMVRNLNAATPVIMMTANTGQWARQKAFDAGCDAYIIKPFEPTELRSHIQRLLKEKFGKPQVRPAGRINRSHQSHLT